MIIPETEIIEYKNKNELKSLIFYKQGFLISIFSLIFLSCLYVLFKSFINVFLYYGFVLLVYIIVSLFTKNKLYKSYSRYFGSDEIALSKDVLYYNICMNIKGNYTNFDSNRKINDIKEIYIRTGWNPKSLVIYFNDGEHIAIHCLYNIEEVKKEIENRLKK